MLPRIAARERTAAIFWHRHDVREYAASICCHGQAPQEKAEAARSAIYGGGAEPLEVDEAQICSAIYAGERA